MGNFGKFFFQKNWANDLWSGHNGRVVHTEEVTQLPRHKELRPSIGEYDWLSGQKPHRRAEQRPQEDGAVASCESHGCQMENSCIPSPSNPATISTQRDT